MAPLALIFLLALTRLSTGDKGTLDNVVESTTGSTSSEDDIIKYYKNRTATITALKSGDKEDHPYPHYFNLTSTLPEFIDNYKHLGKDDMIINVTLSVAGRIHALTELDEFIKIFDIRADGVQIQVIADVRMFNSAANFANDTNKLRRGDVIGCTGHPGRSTAGNLYIASKHIKLLAPCLHQLPDRLEFDDETRFRKRYLDLILNNNVRSKFYRRAQIIAYIRRFLDQLGFLEIETPILNQIPGGATAMPFMTHHHDTNMDLFLRIAPELYHKMLVVGGIERIYEIGQQFRNEEIDKDHSPEFTVCEFYMTYADYNDLMTLLETMLSGLVKSIYGSYKVKYHPQGPGGEEVEMDFTPPFTRVYLMPTLEKELKVKLPPADKLDTPEALALFVRLCEEHKIPIPPPGTNALLFDWLVGRILGKKYINPTFVVDHPQFMSPLAKNHRDIPGLAERFEFYAMGRELGNAYTELNDPETLMESLRGQARQRAAGDKDIPPTNEDFVTALQYGLPPTAGLGLAVDRLVMLLTDSTDIREVQFFPMMKPEQLNKNVTKN